MSSPIGPVEEQYDSVPTGAGPKPINVFDFEKYAKATLPRNAHGYYASGSNDMITLRENRAAFNRLRLLPRVLVDVSSVDTSVSILGQRVSSPICIAPTAMQRMANDQGECATARAAARTNTLMTLSSWSTISLEDVAAAAPQCIRWFQLYIYKDRAVTLDLIRRAERAGYTAIAVTVDTPLLGRREADIRNRFSLPSHLTMGNFTKAGGDLAMGTQAAGASGSGLASYVASLIDKTLTWESIAWLRSNTRLKIVVKGILRVDDAVAAVKAGVDGIWVSNHGARQVDTAPATIEVLADICRAVAGRRVEVYMDGGVTRGTDVVKALALGAKAVFIGRPVLWGLTHSGEDGVVDVLKVLNDEMVLAMQLCGVTNLRGITADLVTTSTHLRSKL